MSEKRFRFLHGFLPSFPLILHVILDTGPAAATAHEHESRVPSCFLCLGTRLSFVYIDYINISKA